MSRVIEYRPTDLNFKGRNPISRSWSFNPGKDWRKTFKFVLETSYSCHDYKQFKWSLVRGLYKTGMQGNTSSMLHLILGIAYCTVHSNRENFPVALNDFPVIFIHYPSLQSWITSILLISSYCSLWILLIILDLRWGMTCSKPYKKYIVKIYMYLSLIFFF